MRCNIALLFLNNIIENKINYSLECSICLTDIKDSFMSTECCHIFHIECISQVLNNAGPVCRNEI